MIGSQAFEAQDELDRRGDKAGLFPGSNVVKRHGHRGQSKLDAKIQNTNFIPTSRKYPCKEKRRSKLKERE